MWVWYKHKGDQRHKRQNSKKRNTSENLDGHNFQGSLFPKPKFFQLVCSRRVPPWRAGLMKCIGQESRSPNRTSCADSPSCLRSRTRWVCSGPSEEVIVTKAATCSTLSFEAGKSLCERRWEDMMTEAISSEVLQRADDEAKFL